MISLQSCAFYISFKKKRTCFINTAVVMYKEYKKNTGAACCEHRKQTPKPTTTTPLTMSNIPAKIAVDLKAEGTTIVAPAIVNPYKQQKLAKLLRQTVKFLANEESETDADRHARRTQ